MNQLKKLSLLAVALFAFVAFTLPAAAQESTSGGTGETSSGSTSSGSGSGTGTGDGSGSLQKKRRQQTATTTREAENETEHQGQTSDDRKAEAEKRLDDTKQKVCKKREGKINAKMTRIVKRGQKQLDLFSTIATRVQNFYTEKGKVLDNYDALVSEVNAKHDAAQTALDTLKSTQVTFKCDGTDPKGAADSFKSALRTEQQALKDYKTAVKNLIVGVKSVQSTTNSTNNDTTNSTTGGSQQ